MEASKKRCQFCNANPSHHLIQVVDGQRMEICQSCFRMTTKKARKPRRRTRSKSDLVQTLFPFMSSNEKSLKAS